jgi:hypothetical protein
MALSLVAWKALSYMTLCVDELGQFSMMPKFVKVGRRAGGLANGAGQTPAGEKHPDAGGKQLKARSQWPRRDDIDEEHDHPDELPETSEEVNSGSHKGHSEVTRETKGQIRSKFFSISRRVNRSITGRP